MTIFEIKDTRIGDTKFTPITRTYYKKVIRVHDRDGAPFRVGTEYRGGNTIKQLTLFPKDIDFSVFEKPIPFLSTERR